MSDTSQGEGWWQASDGQWYPPQQAPNPPPPPPSGTPQQPPHPPQQTVIVQKSNTGQILAIVGAVFCLAPLLIFIVLIVAITFLGESADQKFSTVGSSVGF